MKSLLGVGRLLAVAAVALGLHAAPVLASPASDSLLNADRALAARSREIGFVAAYRQAMAPDARKLDSGVPTAVGAEAISALMAKYPPDLRIDWTPEEAVVADSGELGYTWGHFIATNHDASGKLVTAYGRYLDVWRKQPDGAWRWIADIGTGDPAPKPQNPTPALPVPTDEQVLVQIEKDFAEAQITKDPQAIDAVAAKMAEGFYSFNPTTGTRATKAQLVAAIRSPDYRMVRANFPPFFIRIFGSTAIVQGTNTSTDFAKGQTADHAYAWFDVFEKHDGRWQWIFSQSSRVDEKTTDKLVCRSDLCTMNQPGFSLP